MNCLCVEGHEDADAEGRINGWRRREGERGTTVGSEERMMVVSGGICQRL